MGLHHKAKLLRKLLQQNTVAQTTPASLVRSRFFADLHIDRVVETPMLQKGWSTLLLDV